MSSVERVLVVGGGPAGMTAAIALVPEGSSRRSSNWTPRGRRSESGCSFKARRSARSRRSA